MSAVNVTSATDTVPVICEEPNGLDIVPVTPLPDCVNVIVTTNDAVSIPKIPSRCIFFSSSLLKTFVSTGGCQRDSLTLIPTRSRDTLAPSWVRLRPACHHCS